MGGKVLSENEYFYLSDGRVLTSISDFTRLLKSVDSDFFGQYVNDAKNDFYNWVRGALDNSELADVIKETKDANSMMLAVQSYFDAHKTARHAETRIANVEKHEVKREPVPVLAEEKRSMEEDLDWIGKSLARLNGNEYKAKDATNTSLKQSKASKTASSSANRKKASAQKTVSVPKRSEKKKSFSAAKRKQEPLAAKHTEASSSFSDIKKTLDDDFDLSLDLERDALAKIRERINAMDMELKHPSTYKASKSSEEKTAFPELAHATLKHDLPQKKKNVLHHVAHHVKRAHEHVSRTVQAAHQKVKEHVAERRKSREINKRINAITAGERAKQMPVRAAPKKEKSLGFEVVDQTTNEYNPTNGLDADYSEPDTPRASEKERFGFFKRLAQRLKKTERVVEKELPNLHEFAHERRAEERMSPYADVALSNYHHLGIQDFLRGLLIGILIGMIFLAVFSAL